ncbi:hypothetical protein ABH925_001131 [Streptacidiphilus sp. EB129]
MKPASMQPAWTQNGRTERELHPAEQGSERELANLGAAQL